MGLVTYTKEFSTSFTTKMNKFGKKVKSGFQNSTGRQWGITAGALNAGARYYQRKQLEDKYIAQGMDPTEAKNKAKKATGSIAGNFIKGDLAGRTAKGLSNRFGLTNNKSARERLKYAAKVKEDQKINKPITGSPYNDKTKEDKQRLNYIAPMGMFYSNVK